MYSHLAYSVQKPKEEVVEEMKRLAANDARRQARQRKKRKAQREGKKDD